jgi:hypothetical protein
MRKTVAPRRTPADSKDEGWLDLDRLARVELTSEDPAHPIEAALGGEDAGGWRAAEAGEQSIRILFDAPQRLRRIRLEFEERSEARTQEFALSAWAGGQAPPGRVLRRQQYTFSPPTTTLEVETCEVDLDGILGLELMIRPEIGGGPARASLARMRVA